MLQVGILLKRPILPGMKPRNGEPPTFRGAVDITIDKGYWSKGKAYFDRVFKKQEKDQAISFRPDKPRTSGYFKIDKANLRATSLADDIMDMSLHENFEEFRKERENRKRENEEKEEKQRREVEEKSQQGKQIEPVTSSATHLPVWVIYVALGMLSMYVWQKLMKLFP